MYQGRAVYVGSTDKALRVRIGSHLRHIHEYTGGRAAAYREWAEGKRIIIVAYRPSTVKLLSRQIRVHRAIEAALIEEFGRHGDRDWFVSRI